jgi:DNA polymerase-1
MLPDYKGLRGDPSDNIIGIKGIGEKTATSLLVNFGTIEEIYKQIKKDEDKFIKSGISPRVLELIKNNEEEALFSKTLAKIRTDAPVDFKLPEKTFWENADLKKIENVFSLFEFRSLFARLKSFFGNSSQDHALRRSHSVLEEQDPAGRSEYSSEHGLPDNVPVDEKELQEISIALWLLNSDIGAPELGDILLFAKTSSFETAKEYIFKELKEKKLDKVYEEIEKPIIPIVKNMQDYGILIDKKYFKNLSEEYHK